MTIVSEQLAIEKYWDSFPIPVWHEKIAETLKAFENGAQVVALSGMCGIGKSDQYRMGLEDIWGLENTDYYEDITKLPSYGVDCRIIVDEIVPAAENDLYFNAWLNRLASSTEPVVLIAAHAVKERRLAAKNRFIDAIEKRGTSVYDLGDVSRAPTEVEATATLLGRLGCADNLIELISAHPVLRAPRFLGVSLSAFQNQIEYGQTPSAERHIEYIQATIDSRPARPSGGLNSFWQSLVNTDPERSILYQHAALVTPMMLTMPEVVELYTLVDRTVPLPEEVPFYWGGSRNGFDPYKKS